jgi:N-acetylglucosaminyl-diphospho-decaprenol L-rhamnosyltransferase
VTVIPPTDVLMVNYLTPELARESADSLAGDTVTVYVWDNSSDLPPFATEAPIVVKGDGRNLLYAEANNRLYDLSDSEFVLLLNPDVRLDRAQLAALHASLADDPQAWGVAPRLVSTDGADQPYLRRLPTLGSMLADRCPPLRPLLRRSSARYWCADLARDRDGRVEQPAAACLLLRRTAAGEVLFDPGYPLFFNDTDLARRLDQAGHCRYLGSLSVTHLGGESIKRARERDARWIREQYDRSCFRYCRANLRGGVLLAPVFWLRAAFRRVQGVVGR